VAVAGMSTFLNLYTPQAILPTLAKAFGIAAARTGLTVTAPLLAVALVAPFAGLLSDALGRKKVIVGACAALVLPTLLVARADSFAELLAWRFAQGLLLPFIFAVTIAYVADECEGADAIRTTGLYASGTIFGGFFGRFVAGLAAEFGGWRVAFLAVAVLTAAGAAFVATGLPYERNFRPLRGGLRTTLETYTSHLSNARLLGTCVVGFGMLFSVVGTFTFVNLYLSEPPYLLDPAQLGAIFAVYLVGMVATPLATRLAVRIGRRPTLVLAVAVATAGELLTLVAYVPAVVTGLALAGAGLFVVQALSIGFIGVAVPHARSSAVGMYVTVYYIGGALGAVVPAGIWHRAGWPGIVALVLAVLVLQLVVGWVSWRPGTIKHQAA
jgi:predicted MFS family arabinose efflux permease